MRIGLGALAAAAAMSAAFALAAQSASLPTVNSSMTQVMSVNAQTVWDINSKAFNAKGDGLISSKIKAKDWAQLADAGRALKARALLLAQAPHSLLVTGRDEHVLGEEFSRGGVKRTYDVANSAQIKALIDANPKLFTRRAMILVEAGDGLVEASRRRDARGLYKVSSNLDEVCDGCHEPFWGTDEPPPIPAAFRRPAPSVKR